MKKLLLCWTFVALLISCTNFNSKNAESTVKASNTASDTNKTDTVAEISVGASLPADAAEEDYDKIFTVVEVPAEFPGGLATWSKYLERNLNRDIPNENGAPAGKYTVIVSFIVAKDGTISNVSAENDPGYGTKSEAVRVIQKGP